MSKKEEIINGARELFTTYGFKKVSMDEIAKKSGATKKTIYSYFKDKNDLIKYFLYESISEMKTIIENIESKNLSAYEEVHNIIYYLLDYRKNNDMIKRFSLESRDFSLDIASECIDILNESIMSEIKRLLDKGMKRGFIKKCNTNLASFVIYKMYVALMFEWDSELDKKEVTDNIMNILKDGIFY